MTHMHTPYVVGAEVLCRECSENLPIPSYTDVVSGHRRANRIVGVLRSLEELGEQELHTQMSQLWQRVNAEAHQTQRCWENLKINRKA